MPGWMTHARQQGLEERPLTKEVAQKDVAKQRAEEHRRLVMDTINQNKINFRNEQERLKAEQLTDRHQAGLPQMARKEALQEELQANPHQDFVFAGAKANARFKIGREQEQQARAKKEHGFEMDEKEANDRVLQAGLKQENPKQKDELNRKLDEQEKKLKKIMKDPTIPLDKKARVFEQMASCVKMKNGEKLKTKKNKIKDRAKNMLKRVDKKQRQQVQAQAKARGQKISPLAKAAMKRFAKGA